MLHVSPILPADWPGTLSETEQMWESQFPVLEADSERSPQGVLQLRLGSFCHCPGQSKSWAQFLLKRWRARLCLHGRNEGLEPFCILLHHLATSTSPSFLFHLKIFFHKFQLEQPCDYKWSKFYVIHQFPFGHIDHICINETTVPIAGKVFFSSYGWFVLGEFFGFCLFVCLFYFYCWHCYRCALFSSLFTLSSYSPPRPSNLT